MLYPPRRTRRGHAYAYSFPDELISSLRQIPGQGRSRTRIPGISSAPYHHLMPFDVNEQRLRCSRSNCAGPPITPPSRASSSKSLVRSTSDPAAGDTEPPRGKQAAARARPSPDTARDRHDRSHPGHVGTPSAKRTRHPQDRRIRAQAGADGRLAWIVFANQTAIEPVPVISPLKPPCTPSLPSCQEPSSRTVPNDRGLVITCGRALPAPAGPRRTVAPARRGGRPRRDGAS